MLNQLTIRISNPGGDTDKRSAGFASCQTTLSGKDEMKWSLSVVLVAGLCMAGLDGSAQADDLRLVADQSSIEFVGSKPDGKHKGGFRKFDVAALANFDDPRRSTLNIQIDATSIWSDNDKLTNHLKNPDFFDVRKYPAITFESREIIPIEGDTPGATIKGDMQMLGKSVELEIPIKATVTDQAVEVTTEFTIDRTKWGMDYGQGKIDNEVKITAKLTLQRP
jgi:polyisoprenoid-binding protein YceI